MRFARRIVVIDFDIVYFRATNDLFLERRWNLRPRAKVVQIFLNDDVAAPHKVGVLITDKRDNMPFGRPGQREFGTYFIGYSRYLWVIEKMLQRIYYACESLGESNEPANFPQ